MSRSEDYCLKTEELLQPIVEDKGFELVDVEYVKEGGIWYLRAYIDKEGGITIDDCEAVSRMLSDLLDENDFIADAYCLEVSSPGLTRELKKDRDFERAIGKAIELKIYPGREGAGVHIGILESFDEKSITITEDDGTKKFYEKSDIATIHLYVDF
ncbi:MAG: ribosome maturation factor RimP [Lachnospiraceae bacterium]|jgi:ribosome maturation factor RimP|nr:ribosome maturation factor RimP [Lachnospiraceae bacterium]